jgi:hypothetical protein
MRKGRTITILCATLALAVLMPQNAHAAHVRWLLVHPPVGSLDGDAHMNQGWHSPSNGIDWDDEDGSGTCCGVGRKVYFNVWVYRDSATTQTVLFVQYYQSDIPNECRRFRARLKEYTDQTRIIGYLNYRHAVEDGSGDHSVGANSAGVASRNGIGDMETEQLSWETCSWTGAHVHAEQTNGPWGTWTRNVGSPPGAIPTGSASYTYPNPGYETSVWERRLDWCNPAGIC